MPLVPPAPEPSLAEEEMETLQSLQFCLLPRSREGTWSLEVLTLGVLRAPSGNAYRSEVGLGQSRVPWAKLLSSTLQLCPASPGCFPSSDFTILRGFAEMGGSLSVHLAGQEVASWLSYPHLSTVASWKDALCVPLDHPGT